MTAGRRRINTNSARGAVGESRRMMQAHSRQSELKRGVQAPEAVPDAPGEIDRGRLRRVARRTRHLADRQAKPDDFSENLVVEHEVVRILVEWQAFQQTS